MAHANELRDWRVYDALGQVLILKVRRLHTYDTNGFDLEVMVYTVDSASIDLCLSMFPRKHFRKTNWPAMRPNHSLKHLKERLIYAKLLRRISYLYTQNSKRLNFLTNNFELPVITIEGIEKSRWQIDYSSNESIRTYVSKPSSAPRRTSCASKSGSRSACTLWSLASIWLMHSSETFMRIAVTSLKIKSTLR